MLSKISHFKPLTLVSKQRTSFTKIMVITFRVPSLFKDPWAVFAPMKFFCFMRRFVAKAYRDDIEGTKQPVLL